MRELLAGREAVRKIYALAGHGVPDGLFRRLTEAGRDWLSCGPKSAIRTTFANAPGTAMLDREAIRVVFADGTVASLPTLPPGWERDLETYMVVMDRVGSRLASIALSPDGRDDFDRETLEATGTGTVVVPADLQSWNVAVMKGESLPTSLLPSWERLLSADGGRRRDHAGNDRRPPVLTAEWVRKTNDRWKVVLRLQEVGTDDSAGRGTPRRDPTSLVFEGTYAPPGTLSTRA